jgi:hypothetical protein
MAGNTNPIYSKQGAAGWATITTANTAKDGTGTVNEVFAADATNGSRVEKIIARPLGTNVASVLRLFMNNGSTNGTAANNSLIREISLPAITLIETEAQEHIEVDLDLVLPAGYVLNAVIGTTVAAGWQVTCLGGDY